MTKYFLSCDWGTTSFRLVLANQLDGAIVAGVSSDDGIAATYQRWQQSGRPREFFYLSVIERHAAELEQTTGLKPGGLPVIVSGMASSSIGLAELPYADLPLPTNGAGLPAKIINTEGIEHQVLLISGAKTADDVVRGEETQLIGCADTGSSAENQLYIFPGTHSKHMAVKGSVITSIRTYMTGELFQLLSQQSILKNSVGPGEFIDCAFKNGLKDAQSFNPLHSIFKVRTNSLFERYNARENYNYLSGLLIGTELKDLAMSDTDVINLVCGNSLETYYRIALNELAANRKINLFSKQQAEEAAVKGQLKIAKQLNFLA